MSNTEPGRSLRVRLAVGCAVVASTLGLVLGASSPAQSHLAPQAGQPGCGFCWHQ